MRAIFAVVGFVVFHAVTVAAIVGLAWLGVLCIGLLGDIRNPKVMFVIFLVAGGCWLSAGVLAWSALPRVDRFEPPGPELTEAGQPELFAMIREVAAATNQRMPVHVYAVLEVNAFVAERGGIMGLGSRRVMGIGLALLNAFSADEVRAVIAHEFGHFHGGDTRLGPWVYKTRAGMGRAVINLRETAAKVSGVDTLQLVLAMIEAPFRWMALAYVRLASAVSRAQELSADAVAARAIGTAPVLSGLRRLAGTVAAVEAYFDQEIGTLVRHGVLPPVLAGARKFVEAHRERLAEIDADHVKLGEANPFDSHPPLSERIAAIDELRATLPPLAIATPDERPGIELVRDPEAIVRRLIDERVGKPLAPIEWSAAAPHFMTTLHDSLSDHRGWLADRSVADLDRSAATARELVRNIPDLALREDEFTDELVRRIQTQIYASALSVALEQAGYEVRTSPGEPLRFHRGDEVLDPTPLVRSYLDGELSDDAWRALWSDAGLPDRPWAAVRWRSAAASPGAMA